jgi:precorrin-2 dehydrogenase/sirohydrochlorin ferrochelatase
MKTYPVFLDLRGVPCAVIGGGKVAQGKVRKLLDAGAKVTVISPAVTPALARLVSRRRVRQVKTRYRSGGLKRFWLVYAASNDPAVNASVAREAKEAGILFNVVDCAALSNFIAPALVRRGELVIAVSTGGASPALAKKIRQDLEKLFGKEYALAVRLLAAARKKLLRARLPAAVRRKLLTELALSRAAQEIKRGGRRRAVNRLAAVLKKAGI